jgi:hypothetical protein
MLVLGHVEVTLKVIKIAHYNIAQINIAQAKDEMDSSIMAGFTTRLDEINELADDSKGFVWRLQDDEGNASAMRVFEDKLTLVNMSVWETLEDLKVFVYQSFHKELLSNKRDWFSKITSSHQALWWIRKGRLPSVNEGKIKLLQLDREGPSEEVFSIAKPSLPPAHL